MNDRNAPPSARRVGIDLPAWMWGGNPSQLLESADVRVHRRRSSATGPTWQVQTNESYERRPAGLVSSRLIAGPALAHSDFGYLTTRDDEAHDVTEFDRSLVEDSLANARDSGKIVDVLNYLRLQLSTVPSRDLPAAAAHHLAELGHVTLEGDDRSVFANRSLSVIRRSHSLLWRLKLPSILHRMDNDPILARGELAHLRGETGLYFQSSSGLTEGAYLMDAYLGPLGAALTPSFWSVAVPRSFGSLIITLGQPLAGTTGEASELLQLVFIHGADVEVPVPRLTATASADAVKWWAQGLDDMFAVVSDFAVFAGRDGVYRPSRHLHTVMTVEQLFRRVTSALVSQRDSNARRVLMFTALDTLERLTGLRIDQFADPDFAKATLRRLENQVWPGAAEVLLPTARRAVLALEQLRDGFFLHKQLGRDVVEVPMRDEAKILTPSRATAFYVKALRDATHGHGSNREKAAIRTDVLLAHHDGRLPHDLGLLAYLYLLDMLVEPARLRRLLSRQAAT